MTEKSEKQGRCLRSGPVVCSFRPFIKESSILPPENGSGRRGGLRAQPQLALTAAGEIIPEGRTNARMANKPAFPVSLD